METPRSNGDKHFEDTSDFGNTSNLSDLSDALVRILRDRSLSDGVISAQVADLFDDSPMCEAKDLGRLAHAVSLLDEAIESIVSASSQKELLDRACAGAAKLCESDIAVLSRISGDLVVPVASSESFGPAVSFAIEEGSIEEGCLHTGNVAVQSGADATASISAVRPEYPWTVAVVPIADDAVGMLHVSVALPSALTGALAGFAATLGGCVERIGLEFKRAAQERVLREEVRRWTEDLEDFAEPTTTRSSSGGPGGSASNSEGGAVSVRPEPSEPLTLREVEVLEAVLTGASNAAVASDLVITIDTVKSHMKKILRKYGVANRAELIARHG